MTETLAAVTQLGGGVGAFVLVVVFLIRQRSRVGSTVDDSAVGWINRLEERVEKLEEERDATDEDRRAEAHARELAAARHRAWDTCVLQIIAQGGDVAACGPPPPLTPHPSDYPPRPERKEPAPS